VYKGDQRDFYDVADAPTISIKKWNDAFDGKGIDQFNKIDTDGDREISLSEWANTGKDLSIFFDIAGKNTIKPDDWKSRYDGHDLSASEAKK